MGSKKDMTRKEFLTLTFTLVGTAAAAGACSNDNNGNDGGFGGTFGGTSGTTGHGGTGGTSSGGHGGSAGTSGGGTGGTTATACADPLPETQVSDTTGHTHTVTIPASTLNATSAQTFDTSVASAGGAGAHMHMVTLEPAQLATLKGGGNVTVMSTIVMSHGHMFTVSCH